MFESKYSNFLTILLVIIIIAVVCLLGYVGYNIYKDHNTTQGASDYVDAFIGETETEKPSTENQTATNENVELPDLANTSTEGQVATKKREKYKGFDVLGTIDIPATSVKYPVLDKTTKKSLDTAVSALYPESAELNTPGNVVIVGHNYRNGTFFSNNKKLKNGDKIYITDLYGKRITYVIYNIFEANQNDTSFYNRDTNGAKEITLSTCTDASNDMRLIIEAKEQ